MRQIARRVKRHPSTISRELRRNASTRTWRLDYKPSTAQWHAERRARRPKTAKLAENERLREYVDERLAGVVRAPDGREVGPDVVVRKGRGKPHRKDRRWVQAWSPEQIANRLKVDFPHDDSMRISHEAIFRPCTSKVGAPSSASWSPVCAPGGRYACHEAEPSRNRGPM